MDVQFDHFRHSTMKSFATSLDTVRNHCWSVRLRRAACPVAVICALVANAGCQTNQTKAGAPSSGYSGTPYGGEVKQIPGIIQAEQYDVAPGGKDGITFHYTGEARHADLRATGDAIALARFGSGHVSIKGEPENPDQVYVGWAEDGQWMKYSVHVRETGTYRLGGHFAAGGNDATLSVTFTPDIKTGPIAIPTTAGYQPGVEVYHVWETLDHLADIHLPAGDYVMTVKIEKAGGMNIDYLKFAKIH